MYEVSRFIFCVSNGATQDNMAERASLSETNVSALFEVLKTLRGLSSGSWGQKKILRALFYCSFSWRIQISHLQQHLRTTIQHHNNFLVYIYIYVYILYIHTHIYTDPLSLYIYIFTHTCVHTHIHIYTDPMYIHLRLWFLFTKFIYTDPMYVHLRL